MAWPNRSRRRTELPPDWPAIRTAVLERDGFSCTIRGPRCAGHATHVDHTDQATGPHDHRLEVLRAACQPCHMGRTAKQSHAARPHNRLPVEAHPNHPGG